MDEYVYQCPVCRSTEFRKDRTDNLMIAGATCFLFGLIGTFSLFSSIIAGGILGFIGLILLFVLSFSLPPKFKCRSCKRRWNEDELKFLGIRKNRH